MSKLKLSELGMGGIQERFERAMEAVADNIADERTDPDAKRVVKITVTVDPSGSNRSMAKILVDVETKLKNERPVPAQIAIGKGPDGKTAAREMVQQTIFDFNYQREKSQEKE